MQCIIHEIPEKAGKWYKRILGKGKRKYPRTCQVQTAAFSDRPPTAWICRRGQPSIAVPLPPLSLQKEFAARVSDIRAMQAEQAASRRRLDELFHSMLHRAFNGEL
jgi:hypothetical protein